MRPIRPQGAVAAAATVAILILALTEAAQVYVGYSLLGGPVPWALAFRATAPSWAVFLLLVVPLLLWLDRSPTRVAHPRRVALHGMLGLAFTTLHLAGTAWLGELLAEDPSGYRAHFFRLATVYFVPDLLTYVAIAGAHYAVRRDQEDRRREVEAAQMLADGAEARFLALRGQLRPDFFFNTLNAIAGLLMRGDANRGVETLAALSALLRGCLGVEPGRPVALEDEMERVGGYLSIQELRFPRRLHATCRVEHGAEAAAVPAMSLLHVVESVVDRGLRGGGAFDVGVRATAGGGTLSVWVTRTDPPVDEDELLEVERRVRQGSSRPTLRQDRRGEGVILQWEVGPVGGMRMEATP